MNFTLETMEKLFLSEQVYFARRDSRFYIWDCHKNTIDLDFYRGLINGEIQNGNEQMNSTVTSLTKSYNGINSLLSKCNIHWFILSNNRIKNLAQPLFSPYKKMIEHGYYDDSGGNDEVD